MSTTLPDMPVTLPPHDEVRPFPVPTLLKQVNDVLAQLPKDAPGCLVAAVDQQSAGVYAFIRVANGLSFMAKIDKPYNGKLEYGAELVWMPRR